MVCSEKSRVHTRKYARLAINQSLNYTDLRRSKRLWNEPQHYLRSHLPSMVHAVLWQSRPDRAARRIWLAGEGTLKVPAHAIVLLLHRLALLESRRNLLQLVPKRVAKLREDFRRRLPQSIFGRRRNLRDHLPRLMVQRSHGCHHPGVGDVFQPPAEFARSFVAHFVEFVTYFDLLPFGHPFPGIPKLLKLALHFL